MRLWIRKKPVEIHWFNLQLGLGKADCCFISLSLMAPDKLSQVNAETVMMIAGHGIFGLFNQRSSTVG